MFKDGENIEYYPNGQIRYKGNYKNGKREGEYIVYYSNSQLGYKEFYI